MSYSNPVHYTFSTGLHDYGAGSNEVTSFQIPDDKKARLVDIVFSCTEVCAGSTSTPGILVGTAADTDAYADFDFATTADTDSIAASDSTTAIIEEDIPTGTQVEITLVGGVGTPTGQGYVSVIFAIF